MMATQRRRPVRGSPAGAVRRGAGLIPCSWPQLTTESSVPIAQGLERVRFVNQLTGVAARRTAADDVDARLAAATVPARFYAVLALLVATYPIAVEGVKRRFYRRALA